MARTKFTSERLIVLFLLGVVLFNPPFLSIFDIGSEINGLPLLYVYLFAAWAVLIFLMALIIQGAKIPDDREDSYFDARILSQQRGPGNSSPLDISDEVD